MSFYKNISGKNHGGTLPPAPSPSQRPNDAVATPSKVKVWDSYGRACEVTSKEWRTKVLPDNFQKAWDKPDDLANLIRIGLSDGFVADCLMPARRLHQIDTQPKRGATFLAAILIHLKQFDEAGNVIIDTIQKHGEEVMLLFYLARYYSGKRYQTLTDRTLWHALEVDPNQDDCLIWYQTIHRSRGGANSVREALCRVASLPGSWRAQLLQAAAALQAKDIQRAFALYEEALNHASQPFRWDLLQQMSGDLVQAGLFTDAIRLAGPHFAVNIHGLKVGNNLIKAHVELGQLDAASAILDQLYARNLPGWKQSLSEWGAKIAKARAASTPILHIGQMRPTMLAIEGPVWLSPRSPATELFPLHPGDGVSIAFLGSTIEISTSSHSGTAQTDNLNESISRSLPLFLAEQMAFLSDARVQTLIPWMIGEVQGYGKREMTWRDEDAAHHARQGQIKSDYVVITHLKPSNGLWIAQLRLLRTIDCKCLGTLVAVWQEGRPEVAVGGLVRRLRSLLADQAELTACPPPRAYQFPVGLPFASYLERLEQLISLRCTERNGVKFVLPDGGRRIIDDHIHLCFSHPQNIVTRVMLTEALMNLKRFRANILPEYKEKLALLQKEKNLAEPEHSVVQRILNEVLAA